MLLLLIFLILLTIFFVLSFRDTQMVSDFTYNLRKKLVSPKRAEYPIQPSQSTRMYEVQNSAPQNFSQPADGNFEREDFGLNALHFQTSAYTDTFIAKKRLKQERSPSSAPSLQSVTDINIIENRRYHHFQGNNSSPSTNSSNDSSSNISSSISQSTLSSPTHKQIYEASAAFNKRTSTTLAQMIESAANPPVLPAIVQKKEKKSPIIRTMSTTSSEGTQQKDQPSFNIPPPPVQQTAGTATSTPFVFNFNNK